MSVKKCIRKKLLKNSWILERILEMRPKNISISSRLIVGRFAKFAASCSLRLHDLLGGTPLNPHQFNKGIEFLNLR